MPLVSSMLKRLVKSWKYRQYVRDPLPLKWFQRASTISRTAAVVGMIIWRIAYQRKLWGYDCQRRTSGHIKVTNQTCMKWGICSNSKNTALRLMEKAGLNVTVGAMLSVPPPVSVPPSVSVPVPGTCIRVIPRAYWIITLIYIINMLYWILVNISAHKSAILFQNPCTWSPCITRFPSI